MDTLDTSLIVVSNRLPFTLKRNVDGGLRRVPAAGGLVTAVAPIISSSGGRWLGWPGAGISDTDIIPESSPEDTSPTSKLASSQIASVSLTETDTALYYNGFCNAILWPLLHSMPERCVFSNSYWTTYQEVNRKFALATLETLRDLQSKEKDKLPLVWIQDYHLMLAASIIRQVAAHENIMCKISFFLHIPFPTWDILKILPWNSQVLEGILDCDLIGFHTYDYCLNFVDCCRRGLKTSVEPGPNKSFRIKYGRRVVRVHPLAISIPFHKFRQLANDGTNELKTPKGVQVVLGIDRLDYTKGLVSRFKAFELLLSSHPEYLGKVMLVQIAVPSRTDVEEYQHLREQMDYLVGHINGRFSTASWSPIRYIFNCLSQADLVGIYRDADVGLVTPLRDGMNLVAKEFVACRINAPGVLILSAFAGAGEMMKEALIVNPYDLPELAETIHRALQMPEVERSVRMKSLIAREEVNDVEHWMKEFMTAMHTMIQEDGQSIVNPNSETLTVDDFQIFLGDFLTDKCTVALLLDFDGTLSPLVSKPELAALPKKTKTILERLVKLPNVFIAVISGRGLEDVMKKVGIPQITYAGNHGLDILFPDKTKFSPPLPENVMENSQRLAKQIEVECCNEGATLENKGAILTFHYRNVPEDKKEPLVARVKELIVNAGFKIGLSKCAVESKPQVFWDKGRAAYHILNQQFGDNWFSSVRPIFVGDDTTDEDAMSALKGLAFSFRICSSQTETEAEVRLPGVDSVVSLLLWIEKFFTARIKVADMAI